MPEIKLSGTIMQVGSGKAVYLPKWFCEQFNIQIGQSFTLSPDPKNDNKLQVFLGNAKKSLDRR